MKKKYLIVGGVAGGANAATRLRRLDEHAEIIIFEKDSYVSFSNCSLPYYLSNEIKKKEDLVLMNPEKFQDQYLIQARTHSKVLSVDTEKKTVIVYNDLTKEQYQESYDKLILSPGAKPIIPPIKDIESLPYFVLRNIDDVERIKSHQQGWAHVTVIGGGFIGVEVAENLRKSGIKTTLIEALPQIMKSFDFEMAKFIEKEMLDHDIKLILSKKVVQFSHKKVILDDGTQINTDAAILAIGISPETEFLKSSGISLSKTKHILVNDEYQTSLEHVYAIGDAILIKNALTNQEMPLALAGPANKQGRLVADHINGIQINNKGYIGSSVVKVFDLVAANTGLNEAWIKTHQLKINYQCVYLAPYDHVSIMPNAHPIFMKVVFNSDSGKVLGAQAMGYGLLEKRIDVISVAIKNNMTVMDLQDLELCYSPQFGMGKDPVNQAGYIATNLLRKTFKQIPFTMIDQILKDNAQVIDVRSKEETQLGMLIGAKNIPMNEIRGRLDELDKNRPVYVHCRTGQRSYNVALTLQAHGFDAYNIAGSFIFISYYFHTLNRLTGSSVPFNQAIF